MSTKEEDKVIAQLPPADTPPWITADLIAHTIKTWQPFYRQPLTREDAVEILVTVGNLVDALGESDGKEVCSAGPRVQPRAGT